MKRRPLTSEAKQILRSRGWLSTLQPDLIEALFDVGELRETEAGLDLFDENDTDGFLHGVVSGWQNVYVTPRYSAPFLIHVFGPADWAGAFPLITGGRRRANVVNRTDCISVYFSESEVRKLMERFPALWAALAYLVTLNTEFLISTFTAQAEQNPGTKVCLTLLRLIGDDHFPGYERRPDPVVLPISHQDIAEMSLLSRNTIGPVLKKLESIGAIEQGYGKITILDRECLRVPY